jgi:hypothetical protein
MMGKLLRVGFAFVIGVLPAMSATAATIKTHADAAIFENGTPVATSGGNGTSTGSINVRWNFAANMDRNEWGAYKFDLSSIADKSLVENVAFNTYMHRGNSNNSGKNLHLYALTPGTAGEDWPEASVTYATMPGFTFDADATTNILDVGGAIVDLGTIQLPASPALDAERSLATVTPLLAGNDVLTALVQGMGSNNLLTILITFQSSSNGTWNTITREATQSATAGLGTFAAGDFASFLSFDVADLVVPEPATAASLIAAVIVGLAYRRQR